jgi:hypothetical protein
MSSAGQVCTRRSDQEHVRVILRLNAQMLISVQSTGAVRGDLPHRAASSLEKLLAVSSASGDQRA